VPQFDSCDQLILAGLGIRELHLEPGIKYDAGHIARRLHRVGEKQQGGQSRHSKKEKNTFF
jgi:hypothetical protein